jgi:hypothetical protein
MEIAQPTANPTWRSLYQRTTYSQSAYRLLQKPISSSKDLDTHSLPAELRDLHKAAIQGTVKRRGFILHEVKTQVTKKVQSGYFVRN